MGQYTARRETSTGAAKSGEDAVDLTLRERCPALHEYLTDQGAGEQSARKTSTILIFCEQGLFKVCLRDRQRGEVAFASSLTLWGVLDHLETGLQSDSLDWRKDKTESKTFPRRA